MDHTDLTGLYETIGLSSGISLIIWTSAQAKIAHLRAQAQVRQQSKARPQDRALLAEFQGLKQQTSERYVICQEFDISLEEALCRLEGRVARLETRNIVGAAQAPGEAMRRNGNAFVA